MEKIKKRMWTDKFEYLFDWTLTIDSEVNNCSDTFDVATARPSVSMINDQLITKFKLKENTFFMHEIEKEIEAIEEDSLCVKPISCLQDENLGFIEEIQMMPLPDPDNFEGS